MTSRERLIKAMSGEKTDRTPFSPFLAYWWDAQEDTLTDRGELEFLESIGTDPLFRGHYPVYGKKEEGIWLFKRTIEDCEIFTKINGNKKIMTYHTSKGDLNLGYQYVEEGNTWFLVDHPLKKEKDFLLLKYIMDSTRVEPNYEKFDREVEKLGDRGLLLPLICPEEKTAFQSLLERWAGTENIVYSLMDFPEIVEETLESMYRVSRESAQIAADSNSPFFLSWEDTSTTNIFPQYYRDYILPEINMWCDILHKRAKRYVQHACGQLKALLPDIAESKIDVLESIAPSPTGNIDLKEVNEIFPSRISIVGGIEPVQLLNLSKDEIVRKAGEVINIMEKRGYVLANSDSCPPGVDIEKFAALAQLVKSEKN